MLNTSIPNSTDYKELTIDMLHYAPPEGKTGMKLVKYPFFHPYVDYPRKEIQNLAYHKRLEVFFNEDLFKRFVLKKKKKNVIAKEVVTGLTDVEKKLKRVSNFEFTIQTILCSGFPVNNYFQSMEYYDPSIRTKSLTLKGSSWFPFLPARFDRLFSYLKMEGGLYTVTGIVWVNDALSHPKYLPVLESFTKYNNEKGPTEILKKEEEVSEKRELDMNMFLLNMYRDNLNQSTTIWRSENIAALREKRFNSPRPLSDKESTSLDIQISFQEDILSKLNYAPEITNLFDDLTIDLRSGVTTKYSSVTELDTNIFFFRGAAPDLNNRFLELGELTNTEPENKAYFYWKQIHDSVYNPGSRPPIKDLLDNSREDSGIFVIRTDTTNFFSDEFKLAIQNKRKKLFTKIYDTYKKPQRFKTPPGFDTKISDNFLTYFLEDYNIKSQYDAEVNKKQNKEMYWLYKTLIENHREIKKRKLELEKEKETNKEKYNAYDAIVKLMQVFIDTETDLKNNHNQIVKENLEIFLGKYSDEQFQMLNNVNYSNELRIFIKKMRNHDIEKRAYDYVVSNTDYSDDKNKKELDAIIAEKFKSFNVFTTFLKELATTRIVSNPFWKIETDKFVGVKKGKIALVAKENNQNIFQVLVDCKENTSSCQKKNNNMAAEFLNTELDELKFGVNKDAKSLGFQTSAVYEAYIQVNVIKGKITKENFGSLKCAYLNYSLGAMYQKMQKKPDENYIVKNKIYFDLEKEIENAKPVGLENEKKNKKKVGGIATRRKKKTSYLNRSKTFKNYSS